ncbi:MAG: hypothetical protein AAF849_06835 [Bacteroidota bacterium]
MDLFAEDKANRTIVEIQKVDYDYNYDRFSHYFMANMLDVQTDSNDYSYAKDIYVIVVITAAYRIRQEDGEPIKDGFLLTDINPRNLRGELIKMQNHKMILLNTEHITDDIPENIRDWMTLIKQSQINKKNPEINLEKKGIAKAASLANLNLVSPEQIADAKIQEMRKKTLALVEDMAREEEQAKTELAEQKARAAMQLAEKAKSIAEEAEQKAEEAEQKANQELAKKNQIIKNLAQTGMSLEQIAQITALSEEVIRSILEQ